jgi:hypothetical protein
MTRIVVFLGPSLPLRTAAEIIEANYLAPAQLGSIYEAVRDLRPDIVALIDGSFRDVLAVWHREILWAMTNGVHVFGAASMGALRASELAPYGMRGVGKIFAAYRSGIYDPYAGEIFEDDDEVAVVHGPAETGFVLLSDAMVDIREALARAAQAGVITTEVRNMAAAWAKAQHYPDRSMTVVQNAIRQWDRAQADLLTEWWVENSLSQKSEDTTQLLLDVRKFAQDYPGPCSPSFEFERALVWERLRRKLDGRRESTALE